MGEILERALRLLADSRSSSDNMSQSDLIVGLRDEIVDTMGRIEEVNWQIKHSMVPVCLTHSIRTLSEQDEVSQFLFLCDSRAKFNSQEICKTTSYYNQ